MKFRFFREFLRLSDENRYYVRDFIILLLTILISVFVSELVFFREEEDLKLISKLDTYLFLFLPFFILSIFLSYLYRNRRNRETGKIRSSIRYRLTLAFLFVAMIPSLPILFLSSNLMGKSIEAFYRIDVSEALRSSKYFIKAEESANETEFILFANQIKNKVSGLRIENAIQVIQKSSLPNFGDLYISIVRNGVLLWESKPLYQNFVFSEEWSRIESDILANHFYSKEICYHLLRWDNGFDYEIWIGNKIHKNKEDWVASVMNATSTYEKVSVWREKIPTGIRLSIALFTVFMFFISILFSFFFARRISMPIIDLANATKRVSLGDSDIYVKKTEEGEIGILVDSFHQMVSDLKSKSEELMHTQRIAAWKEVAQRMAHEIKNPLTPIQLSAQRLQRKLKTAKKEDLESIIIDSTETIIGQVRVLEHLVKEFSEFARMPVPVLINQNVNPIVEEAVSLFKDSVDIQFEVRLSTDLPEVFLDKRLFLGVINNLIKNAVEAIQDSDEGNETSKQRPAKHKIRISSRLQRKALRKSVLIEVEDSGPGLREDWREKIFEPYFSTKEKHGSGIGLAIVQKTVIDHHGHISVESSRLGGCKFRIELPLEV